MSDPGPEAPHAQQDAAPFLPGHKGAVSLLSGRSRSLGFRWDTVLDVYLGPL